jgi:glutamate--cysteine ligase
MKELKTIQLIEDKSQLLDFFYNGIKPKNEFMVGIEFEKPGIDANSLRAISYSGVSGMLEFLKNYKEIEDWDFIKENSNILGLINGCNSITLEPGSQIEISNCPGKSIHDIVDQIAMYNTSTAFLAEDFDIYWLGYGIQPLSSHEEIELIPKKRYDIMTEYLPEKGPKSLVMMRETAGIQTSIDYESEEDAINKFRILVGLSPIVTAIFANSPIRKGVESGYKSFRASAWLETDPDRCGLVSKSLFDPDFTIEDYIDILLNLPMIFLKKGDNWINMKGMSFKEYLENGYGSYKATVEDWALHRNSYFPDVRLNDYIEIRNCDCQRSDLIPAVPALWKGIIYNDDALNACWEMVEKLSWEERLELRSLVPRYGLDTKFRNMKVGDLAKEMLSIAGQSLDNQAALGESESIYLERAVELVNKNQSPADEILQLWNTSWNKDLKKLVDYVRLT